MSALATERDAQPAVFFDAVLTPHRSLGPRGFLILMSVLAAISFASGVLFVSIGAWPVFGFFGLDVALVYFAFRVSYRQARAFETITLTEAALLIRRVSDRGVEQRIRLEPYWLKVEMEEDEERGGAPLILSSHGRRLSIGAFLSPRERAALAQALRSALERRKDALLARPD